MVTPMIGASWLEDYGGSYRARYGESICAGIVTQLLIGIFGAALYFVLGGWD